MYENMDDGANPSQKITVDTNIWTTNSKRQGNLETNGRGIVIDQ